MKILVTTLIVLLSVRVQAKGTDLDSLSINILNEQLIQMAKANPKAAIARCVELDQKLKGSKWTNKNVQKFYYRFARILKVQGLFDEALAITSNIIENSNEYFLDLLLLQADIYSYLHKFDQAEKYYNAYILEVGDNSSKARALNNLANNYMLWNKYEKAIETLSNMRQIITSNDTIDVSNYYHNSGESYCNLGDFDLSKSFLLKALTVDKMLTNDPDYKYYLLTDYQVLGKLHRKKGELTLSLTYLDSALENVSPNADKAVVLDLYKDVYSVCEDLNEYQKGFQNSLKYTTLRDSIFSEERLQNLGTIELKSFLVAKQREEEDRLIRIRLLQYTAIFIMLLITAVSILLLKRLNLNQKFLQGLALIILLLTFEFILVIIEPFLNKLTDNVPIFILIGNFSVALAFAPLHRLLENWFNKKLVGTVLPSNNQF